MQFWLFFLIWAIVLPVGIAFSLLLFDFYRHEREVREQQLFSTAKAMATAVDADLGRGWALLDGSGQVGGACGGRLARA